MGATPGLVYNSTPNNKHFWLILPGAPVDFASASLGMDVEKDGTLFDVFPGTPAYEAGLGPNITIVAVDGHDYSPDALTESIAHPRNGVISLVIRNFTSIEAREIHYSGGVRHPHLERIPEKHDYLTEILAPKR